MLESKRNEVSRTPVYKEHFGEFLGQIFNTLEQGKFVRKVKISKGYFDKKTQERKNPAFYTYRRGVGDLRDCCDEVLKMLKKLER